METLKQSVKISEVQLSALPADSVDSMLHALEVGMIICMHLKLKFELLVNKLTAILQFSCILCRNKLHH